jgi:RND family efflux transporter MFP subunit
MKTPYYLLAILVCYLPACKHAPRVEIAELPLRVSLEPVKTEQISLPVLSSGIVMLSRETRLSFKTGGIVAAISVDEGSRVRKGDVLAALNLAEIEAQVKQANNGYEKALRDYNRAKELYSDSVVTLEQLQNSETAVNVARSNLDMVEFNRDYSRILAPDNGTILKRFAEANEMIAPGYPVFLFGTEGRFWKIKTGLADRDFVRISPGDSALISMDAYPDIKFRGVINQISESADPMTGTYEVELDLDPAGHKLASGFVANLVIYPLRKQSYRVVPLESIIQAEGQTGYVYVVSDSMIARKRMIKVEAIIGSDAAISNGLEKDTHVVAGGAAYLTEGDRVEIAK